MVICVSTPPLPSDVLRVVSTNSDPSPLIISSFRTVIGSYEDVISSPAFPLCGAYQP